MLIEKKTELLFMKMTLSIKKRIEINLIKTFSTKQVFQRKAKSSIKPKMSRNEVK
jgi:hypothetical protein